VNLEILTPEKKIFEGKVVSVSVPGTKGPFTVLHNHAPIISTLTKGEIKYVTGNDHTDAFEIESGIIEVKKNKIIILVD